MAAAALAAGGIGSVVWTRHADARLAVDGAGCNQAGSATIDLPAGAYGVIVEKPKVGTTGSSARVTDIAVAGSKVTITAVGAGDESCAPSDREDDPAKRAWAEIFAYRIAYSVRVTVAVQRDWATRAPFFVVRPKSVRIAFVGAIERIRWRRYGGATAIGFGVMNMDGRPGPNVCRRARCDGNRQRMKVVLGAPSYCAGDDHVFYGRVAFVNIRQLGVLKPGTAWVVRRPICGSYPAIRVR